MTDRVVISRYSADEKPKRRVWVTGPHFESDIYSSTEKRDEASTFTRDEAEALLRSGTWRELRPLVVKP